MYAAVALGVHGTPWLEPVFDRYAPGWRARGAPPTLDAARVDGRYTLDKAPGVTLLAAPVIAAAQAAGLDPGAPARYPGLTWWLTLILAAAPTAAFAVALRRRLQPRSPGEGAADAPPGGGEAQGGGGARGTATLEPATWVVAPLVLGTPWLAYGGLLFGHALAASLAGLGALGALGALEVGAAPRRAGHGAAHQPGVAALGGLALGWAVVTDYPAALVVLAVLLGLLADRRRRGRLPWVALGAALPLAALLTWNAAIFGSPTAISYHFKAFALHAGIHAQGLYGVTWPDLRRLWELSFGSQRGLFFQAPWLLVGVGGAVAAALDRRLTTAWRVTLPLGALGLPVVLAGFVDWRAGDALGPRHWLPALPFVGMAAAAWGGRLLDGARRGASANGLDLGAALALGAVAGLVVSSSILAILGAWISPYFAQGVVNPIFEVNLPILFQGGAAPTIWRLASPCGLSGVAPGTPSWLWVAAAACALALSSGGVLHALWTATRGRRALAALVVVGAAAIHLSVAAGPTTGTPAPATPQPIAPAVTLAQATTWELLGHPRRAQKLRRALRRPHRHAP